MCFSYAINFSANALQSKLQLGDVGPLEIQLPWETPTADATVMDPGYFLSGFDRPLMPVLTIPHFTNHCTLTAMRWGLIPHWCKTHEQSVELSIYGLNARSETLDEKPLFRDAWKSQPCLIPASGFFEWQSVGKRKQPYDIGWFTIALCGNICCLVGYPNGGRDEIVQHHHNRSERTDGRNTQCKKTHAGDFGKR